MAKENKNREPYKIYPPFSNNAKNKKIMKTIEINGLSWDVENLELNGETCFTCDGAMLAAKVAGKRLPTKEEFEALEALGSTWDSELKGRWFGEDSELKQESEKSIFFPASGYRDGYGALNYVGHYGYYWSSSVSGASDACYLHFCSGGVRHAYDVGRDWGHSVRCVKVLNNNMKKGGMA
jgi:uncharacterized protein (TIGR02145 family)